MPRITKAGVFLVALQLFSCDGLSMNQQSRRDALASIVGGGTAAAWMIGTAPANAVDDIDAFLRTGGVSMPMGVAGQAGKGKPETGVLLREGTDISRDSKSGNVLAEILVKKTNGSEDDKFMAVVTSFQSPWPLGA